MTDLTAPVPDLPVLPDLPAECSATALAPMATDFYSGAITGTTTTPFPVTAQGTTIVIWSYDDGNGNSMDVSQNLLISDLIAPSATCPDDVNTCEGSVSNIGLRDVTENCSTPDSTYELSGATTGSGSGDASTEIFAPGETTVTYTLEDGNGNGSLCTFTVTHQVVDEIVVNLADGILNVESPGSYQWINCENNSVVEGETGSSFKPGVNGEYAVIVTQGACSSTSEFYLVDYTGLQSNGLYEGIELYPNPADQFITIKLDRKNTKLTIKVISTSGQAVLVESMDRLSETRFDISNIKAGMYLIQIHSDQMDRIVRFMKE